MTIILGASAIFITLLTFFLHIISGDKQLNRLIVVEMLKEKEIHKMYTFFLCVFYNANDNNNSISFIMGWMEPNFQFDWIELQ